MRRVAVGALAVLVVAGVARAEDAPTDAWFAQFRGGQKAGWSHHRRVHTTIEGRPAWVSTTESLLVIGAAGSADRTKMTSSTRFVEDDAGAVLSYSTSFDLGLGKPAQTRAGTVVNGVIAVVEDGKTRSAPYPAGALGPAAVDRAIVAGLAPGARGRVVAFQAIDAGSSNVSWKVVPSTEVTNVLGRYMWLTRVEKTDESGLPELALLGQGGREFAGANDMGASQWFLTEEAIAKFDGEPTSLITSRIVTPDRAITGTEKPLRAVLRLSKKSGAVKDLPEECGQRIVARGKDGSIDVEISAAEPPADTNILGRPYAGKSDMKRFLAATPLVELDNPRLREFAGQAIHGLINSLKCARAIEQVVHEELTLAPADVGFASACEAISSGTGDSTESAVLAAAYARSCGMPARLVAGFVYWGSNAWPDAGHPRGGFAFHAWTEMLVADGVWYAIDPVRMQDDASLQNVNDLVGHGGFDATHVAVLKSDLATERPFADVVAPVLAFMDGLSIEVLEPKAPHAPK